MKKYVELNNLCEVEYLISQKRILSWEIITTIEEIKNLPKDLQNELCENFNVDGIEEFSLDNESDNIYVNGAGAFIIINGDNGTAYYALEPSLDNFVDILTSYFELLDKPQKLFENCRLSKFNTSKFFVPL